MSLTDTLNKETDNNANENNSTETTTQQQGESASSYFDRLVGEGKKFATPEEAIEALGKKAEHADSFIEELKNEKRILEDQYKEVNTKVMTQEEIFNAILNKDDTSLKENNQDAQTVVTEEKFTPDQVKKIVDSVLQEKEQVRESEAKVKKAMEYLEEQFETSEKVRDVINAFVGDSEEKRTVVDTLALTDPERLAILLKGSPDAVNFTRNGEHKSGFPTQDALRGQDQLTWSEAKKIKRENPVYYRSIDFQKKMNNAIALDENFYKK